MTARLTLDDLEIERNGEPLEFEAPDGTVFALVDPRLVDAVTLTQLEQLSQLSQLKAIVADGRFDELCEKVRVDGYFIEALMKKWLAHFGAGSPGNAVSSPSI